MGNSSSTLSKCRVCSTSDSSRPSITPGCCGQSYHMDCLQSHLSTRNTTCLKCHHVFPTNILDLHAATLTSSPQSSAIIPHALAIPAPVMQYQQQQQQQQQQQPVSYSCSPPFPPCNVRGNQNPQLNFKEMYEEEPVSPWTPPDNSLASVKEPTAHKVLIESSPELSQVPLAGSTNFHSVISVSALSQSDAEICNESSSPPMDIVCVLDVSGSMSCDNKLNNLKYAVNFMRDELKETDRMSVITFERSSTRVHGLLKMNSDNKTRTERFINQLSPGGGTRILSGLREACQVLKARQSKNPISSVFLLTDGQDPSDLREKKQIAKEIKDMGASLFVYGFGNDHDSLHLKTIADAGEGTFTFIEKSDMVIDAFGGALGAEKSIFAQSLCLSLTAANGSKITNVSAGSYRKVIDPNGLSANVYFPNLMFGEQRDVLVALEIPPVAKPEEGYAILTSSLEYHGITDGSAFTLSGHDCLISRVTAVEKNIERDNNVDVQINRVLLDTTTAASLALADQGNYKDARKNLNSTLDKIRSSGSCRRNDKKTVAFVSELEATLNSMENEDIYRYGGGRSMMSEMASNISQQRCTYSKSGRSNAYQNTASLGLQEKSKSKKMKMSNP